ncbi:hypothetical protein FHS51_003930 [Sphingobium wenxiniae]|uniref:hypothetical protein n=1 Tax=Sphingobium wenxiniae (strain DSM 21828 / CGMCC 1.7748 / JZ-1) TaxID=595605 RepID=UPI00160DC8EE|nr:hypothetical protein [Sphingobium wenxiniae]MBB6193672.1 hypothetical protein [Sphingobium wenxiniae]
MRIGDRRAALTPSETSLPLYKRLTGCGAIIARLAERCLCIRDFRASRFQLSCKLLTIGGDCGQRFASDPQRFPRGLVLSLQILEAIEVGRDILMFGLTGVQDLRGSLGDI